MAHSLKGLAQAAQQEMRQAIIKLKFENEGDTTLQ